MFTYYELRDAELPPVYPFSPDQTTTPGPATIPPHGTIESFYYDVAGEDLVAISERRKHLYVWGTAYYRDVFPGTSEHITKFCVYARTITGDPTKVWNREANPVEIMFATYHQHNCADEDCGEEESPPTPPA